MQLEPIRARVGTRPVVFSARLVLAPLVVATAALQAGLGFTRATPSYLPDEFLYASLARSLAGGEGIAVLGTPSPFPALLEPLLASAFWHSGSAELAIRLVQVSHAVWVALAVLPAYAIARRVGVPTSAALVCAAAAAIGPASFFAGYLTAEAVGYLACLLAVDAALRALSRPAAASQLVFLGAASVATFARIQYAALFAAFLVAALVVERGRFGVVLRRYAITCAAFSAAALAGGLFGAGALGRYRTVTGFGLSGESMRWGLSSSFLVAIAAGLAIVPPALAWTLAALRRGTREESGFAALLLTLAGLLIGLSSVLTVETASDRFLERYLIALVPLTFVAGAAWFAVRPFRPLVLAVAVLFVVALARVPLSGFTEGQGRADSPTLFAVGWLLDGVGVGGGSLLVALALTLVTLLGLGVAVRTRPGLGWTVVAGLSLTAVAAIGAGARVFDADKTTALRTSVFATSPSWVDAQHAGAATLVQTPGSNRFDSMLVGVWNRSIDRAVPLGDRRIDPLDGLGAAWSVAADGTLLDATGNPVETPVVVATGGTAVTFGSRGRFEYDRRFVFHHPAEPIRLGLLADGIRFNGRLAPEATISVFPRTDGSCTRVRLVLSLPSGDFPETRLELRTGGDPRVVALTPGRPAEFVLLSDRSAGRTASVRTLSIGGRPPGPFAGSVADVRYFTGAAPCGG
ncbi:MAG: hypothetical protein ACKVUT_16025 [Gaiella sp.]